jgi:hypothetical protein
MSDQEELTEGYRLPIEWYYPEDIISRYATNMVVQHTEHEFIISFFEIQPPVVLGEIEAREAQLDKIESVRANCIARVIVAPERLAEFIQVLQDNWDKYLCRQRPE